MTLLAAVALMSSSACAHGYLSTEDLDRGGLGPSSCSERCGELGMEMGALVLVQHGFAGCVCAPRTAGSVAPLLDSAGAAASGQAVIAIVEEQQRQQQQQRR